MLAMMISKLDDSRGRAEVINSKGAFHETADEAMQPSEEHVPIKHDDCVPPAGTPVILTALQSHASQHLNNVTGIIRYFDERAERFKVQLDSGGSVRVKRGNFRLVEASPGYLIAALQFKAAAHEDVRQLAAVHGEQQVYRLLAELVVLPCRLAWTVADDVWLVAEHWRVRAGYASFLLLSP